jgi:hypothetical protein
MAKRMPTAKPLMNWRQRRRSKAPLSSRGFGKVVSYLESELHYRIDHFVSVGELPFFAVLIRGGSGSEYLSRHATFDEAEAACDRHRLKKAGGAPTRKLRFNSAGDPMPRK